jgi:hypothetical protein
MQELILGPGAVWFGVPALIGTFFFALRLGTMLIGGADADVGADADIPDLDAVDGGGDVDASSETFKVLSIQSIAAFLMGFGWGGLGAFRGSGWSFPVSVLVGTACGLGMTYLLARLLLFVYRLQTSGTLAVYHALEAEGTVYARVPAAGSGSGRVRVVIGDRARYYKAVTDGAELPRDARVRVVEVDEATSSVKVEEA